MGMFYRTIRMLDNGIKPVFVFDGKPPTLKSGEVHSLIPHLCHHLILKHCISARQAW